MPAIVPTVCKICLPVLNFICSRTSNRGNEIGHFPCSVQLKVCSILFSQDVYFVCNMIIILIEVNVTS